MRLVWYRGSWSIYLESGRRVSCRTKDRVQAERELDNYKRGLTAETESVGQIVEAYLEDRKNKTSHASMKWWWKNAKPFFGDLVEASITREKCREYTQSRSGAANETIRHELGIVRAGLRWKNRNSPAMFELPPRSPARKNHLSKEDFKRLLNAFAYKHLKLFAMLAVTTAGRKSAILELTWDRVDFERRHIILSVDGQKSNKGRATVPINDSLYAALAEARKIALTPYVVEYGCGRVKAIDKGFRSAAKEVGLDVTPHDLRRTAAIWMAEARVPMSEIASYLGHEDSRTTEKHYAQYSPDFLKKAANALEF